MKLWKISQTESTGYDTFSDAVVVADNEDAARSVHPACDNAESVVFFSRYWLQEEYHWSEWATKKENVTVVYLGIYDGPPLDVPVICASYHAG